jgi:hypothetical protein
MLITEPAIVSGDQNPALDRCERSELENAKKVDSRQRKQQLPDMDSNHE